MNKVVKAVEGLYSRETRSPVSGQLRLVFTAISYLNMKNVSGEPNFPLH